jgi:hypothetical protein
MITVFNRKELVTTYSMEEQANIREKLKSNKIDYRLKTINRNSKLRGNIVIIGQNVKESYEYIFYVNKSDYDNAKFLIR